MWLTDEHWQVSTVGLHDGGGSRRAARKERETEV